MRISRAIAILIVWIPAIGACASAGSRGRCTEPLAPEFAGSGTVYRACEVDRVARLAPGRVAPPQGFTPRKACGSALLEFVVDATGRPLPDPVRIIRSNDTDLVQAMRAELPSKRYEPAMKNGIAVPQVTRSEFRYGVTVVAAGTPSAVSRNRASAPKC